MEKLQQAEKPTIFIKDSIIPVLTLAGTAWLLLSLNYNYGYFSTLNPEILRHFSISDLLVNSIYVLIPALGVNILAEFMKIYRTHFPSKNHINENIADKKIMESNDRESIATYFSNKLSRTLKILMLIRIIALTALGLFWIFVDHFQFRFLFISFFYLFYLRKL